MLRVERGVNDNEMKLHEVVDCGAFIASSLVDLVHIKSHDGDVGI
jgi:hypothetical protein